ncbi:hypothetical protein VCUG_01942 [Vavraia culicis subsp. floridensis]|uniref:Vacuolar import/degradation Vid27 C-terminal domain-containing protein n=1 Tax=Vavraia culicis (isolate floridensis) TaxID=948595 RepID=L2GSF9_VAVCU|nr:uncharacterized protein VCUG_01942 [Vavraia culicis subsp. floridensis]ELA46564.1 hypothetical protein VCUG_01942 [Vavraia culicis subsp. floridensis]
MLISAFRNLFLKKRLTANLSRNGTQVLTDAFLDLEGTTIVLQKDTKTMKYPVEEMQSTTRSGNKLMFSYKGAQIVIESVSLNDVYTEIQPLLPTTKVHTKSTVDYYFLEDKEFVLCKKSVGIEIVHELQDFIKIMDDRIYHFEVIRANMQFYMDKHKKSFVWAGGDFKTYMVVFYREIEFLEFMSLFLEALKKESGFVGGDYGVVEGESRFTEIEKDAFDEAEEYSFTHDRTSAVEEHSESVSEEQEEDRAKTGGDGEEYNSLLYTDKDMAFVARGNTVGVFSTADKLRFNCSIKNVEGKKRKFLKKDNQLLFLDEHRRDVKFLDLEKGKVVERIGLARDVNDVMLRDSEVLGMNDNSVFVVDSRTKGIGRDNTYKTKTYFTKGSTSGTFSAIGSVKGDLRVYKDVFKRARILVSGLGDEVVGIDIGEEYVILTFKNYLILFKIEERKDKRKVVRLQLRPEHVAFLKHNVSFTPGKFNESNTDIITSTGNYVVTWRVSDVLGGNLYAYKMREYGSEVVDDSFVGEDRVLVTLKDDLKMLNKKNIK